MEVEVLFKAGTVEDCAALVEAMDKAERDILRLGWGVMPLDGLVEAVNNSRLYWTAFIDGEVACIFGVTDTGAVGVGCPWILTAPLVRRAKVRFVRQSARVVKEMFEHYDTLVCHVWGKNRLLMNWTKWLGFEMSDMGNGFFEGRLEKCAYRY